jgi:hypothetical protein
MDNVLVKNGFIRHDFITGKGSHGKVIMGRRALEAGYIFAPYIPLQLESTVYDPNDFQPTREVMSRYATTVVDNRFYSEINVGDFDTMGDD